MNARALTIILLILDFCTAALVWFLFYVYRIITIEHSEIVYKGSFFYALILVPVFWILLYILQGTYRNVLRNYRLKTIKLTLFASLLGTILVFFIFLLNDIVNSYQQYYTLFLIYFGMHFIITLIPRLIVVTIHVKRIHSGRFGFNTLIIGGSDKAVEILEDIRNLKKSSGHHFVGFIL